MAPRKRRHTAKAAEAAPAAAPKQQQKPIEEPEAPEEVVEARAEVATEPNAIVPVKAVKKPRKDGRVCARCGATESVLWHFKDKLNGPEDDVFCHNNNNCRAAAGCADYRKRKKAVAAASLLNSPVQPRGGWRMPAGYRLHFARAILGKRIVDPENFSGPADERCRMELAEDDIEEMYLVRGDYFRGDKDEVGLTTTWWVPKWVMDGQDNADELKKAFKEWI